MDELFRIENLSFSYPDQTERAVDELSLTIRQGDFWVFCGPSGCGKSTLLRQLKTVLAPHGRRTGEIFFEGVPLEQVEQRKQAGEIGFVLQSPEDQVVTDQVWHELAFGLESLGFDQAIIRRRVAEMASFFGMEDWFYRDVAQLSGGQKQLLNLASVMVMQPKALILDEPTSQLDPIAASDFLATLGKINRELGTTVLLTEHRLEEAFPLASAVMVMDRGRRLCTGTPAEVGRQLKRSGHGMFLAMPTPMRVWAAVKTGEPCPVTVREGRDFLTAFAENNPLRPLPPQPIPACVEQMALEVHDAWFRYEKDSPDVVKGLQLAVRRGEFLAILGGNGTGKTTTLRLLSGLKKPYRGSVTRNGALAALPQNPQALFVKKTVGEDLQEVFQGTKVSPEERQARIRRVICLCRLEELWNRHPYDLSGGEQQRAALAKVLLLQPEILLLDEPTKGLDAEFKRCFAGILGDLLGQGVAIVMVSHDVEFCARYAHRCALFFDGNVVTQASPRKFFSGNRFYTTSANRMARHLEPEAVTAEDLIALCGGTLSPEPEVERLAAAGPGEERPGKRRLPPWRRLIAGIAALASLALFVRIAYFTDMTALLQGGGVTSQGRDQLALYAGLIGALFVFAAAIGRRSKPQLPVRTPKGKRKLAKRTVAAAVMILLLIPVTLYAGVHYLGNRKYYVTALLVMLECMLPFFLIFEGRKPQARELTVVAVLCAMGVASRAAFFMLPQFKPVMALTILAGVAFGGETGFLVGAVTMLLSNMLFSQGPWTPWQMFSMGIAGFLAGVLFQKGLLRRSRGSLCVFGALAVIIIYGGIMNATSLLMWSDTVSWELLLPYYISGFPMDCVHAAATVFFLWLAGEPMLEKLERIQVKYGLVE